jgi:hypothetical protein
MPQGTITHVNVSNGKGQQFGFVSCPGRPDLRFDAADMIGAELTAEVRGRKVTYNEAGNRATHVRLVAN